MTRLARTERAALCDLALELGPDAPTLSGDWTVKDLVVHLLVREGNPAAIGIVVPPLARWTDLASERLVRQEDIRRAQEEWEPRELADRVQDVLWKMVRVAGKGLVRSTKVGVVLERSDTAEQAALKPTTPSVVVRGLPAELVMFVYGRQSQAHVELLGADADVAALTGADLGV